MHKEEDTNPGSTNDTYSGYTSYKIFTIDYRLPHQVMGYENILVITDYFTKFAQEYPAKN